MGVMKDFDIRIRNGGDDAIAAVGELMPRWIPVSERLPTVETRCLIWELIPNQDMAIEFASWLGDRWKTHGAISSILHPSMVSHWMPLPEPPEVK